LYTAQQFLDFARTKPAEEHYNYGDNDNCAFCQFLHAMGHPNANVGGWGYNLERKEPPHPYADPIWDIELPAELRLDTSDGRNPLQSGQWGDLVLGLEEVLNG
jgi:hypothetical protein